MTPAFALLGVIAALVIAYVVLTRTHRSKFFALAEYWIFLPAPKMPGQEELMDRMIRGNPYTRRGVSPIGPKEGLLFTDIRLDMALVLRKKNPHLFRPDLYEEHAKPSPELIESLNQATALIKIRYASDIPLAEKTHLQFLLHAADAIAELGNGTAIFDLKAERLFSRNELQDDLKQNFDATKYSLHTVILWRKAGDGGIAETRGLGKIGLDDLRTAPMDADSQIIATNVMTETLRCIWENGELPKSIEITTFDDTFKVQFEKMKNELTQVRILRVQAS